MSKFSVKKPITVLVAVVIVLVLGFVSFTRMTPDLMPNMDLPYVVVMTTYPGATPEEVEENLTKPLEQSLSTLENIEEVSSTSSANYSTVILQFTEDVNMDTISVDILQKINLISENFDDSVGTPMILKLNPTMMPVTVAALSYEGKNLAQLSTFVDDTLMYKLEGTAGVASISANGLLNTRLGVVLSPEKIASLNAKIKAAVSGNFTDAESELSDAQSQLDSGKQELENGKQDLEDGRNQFTQQITQAGAQLTQQQQELLEGKRQIAEQLANLQTQLTQLTQQETQLKEVQSNVTKLEQNKTQLENSIQMLQELQTNVQQLEQSKQALDERVADALTEEAKQAIMQSDGYKQVVGALATIDTQLKAQGLTRETIPQGIEQAQQGLAQVNQGLSTVDSSLATMGLNRSDLANTVKELAEGKQKIEDGITQLQTTQKELESGEKQLSDAMQQLEQQKTQTMFQLSDAAAQLISGESTLNASQAQIEASVKQLDDAKEQAYKQTDLNNILTMDTLAQILAAQNFEMPAGYAEENNVRYMVSVGQSVHSEEEMRALPVLDLGLDGVDVITLGDIADVKLTDNRDEIYTNINGNDGILLTFSKQSTYATAEVGNNINDKFRALEEEYPGLSFTPLVEQGEYIYTIVYSIMQSLIAGAVFAVLILFLFLKSIKPTFIILCSIPISVVFAFVLMYFSGVTLNMISMSGLAVAVGMLVDNSVVVIENIFRLRNKGMSAVKSAIIGASQVTAAIASSTLTTICVFLPIVFVEGLTRQLFTDMALTMGYALLASLIVALTLVPAMSSRMLQKPMKQHKNRIMNVFLVGYEKSLRWSLRFKPIVIIGAIVLLVGSAALAMARGFVFMPESSATEVSLNLEMPEEFTVSDTRKVTDEAVQRISEMSQVETVGAMLASSSGGMMGMMNTMGGMGGTSAQNVTMYITLKGGTKQTSNQVTNEIMELCSDLDCTITGSDMMGSGGMMGGLTSNSIDIRLYANDLDSLQSTAKEIAAKLSEIDGTVDVTDGMEETEPTISVIVDKTKAMEQGLTVAQVYQELAKALQTEVTATNIQSGGDQYDVVLIRDASAVLTPQNIRDYTFTMTPQGSSEEKTIVLADIATILDSESLASINRVNQNRYLDIKATVKDGYNISHVSDAAKAMMAEMELPADCRYEFTGGNEDILSSMGELVQMLLLGILLVYLIMVAQFQSLKHPFIIMFTIPLAFTGGLLALLVTGMEVSVISMVGFVMLCGIIVNNGIVLVDYINQLRLAGFPKKEALVEAGKTRMRPILMTTVTTILGLSVMALGIGGGNEMMQPVAVVCIGGLIYATLLTLYIIPIIYDLINRKDMKRLKKEDVNITAEDMLDDEFEQYQQKLAENKEETTAKQNDQTPK